MALSQTPTGLCEILRKCVPLGIAYHNANLSQDERVLIEDAYRNGVLTVLITTSTLSAGVNLPANRVIIRNIKMGTTQLTVSSFRQMCGRAGRLGLDTEGEAIIMASPYERQQASSLILSDMPPLLSRLHEAGAGGLEKLILEIICFGRGVRTEADAFKFVECTLLGVQKPKENVAEWTKKALAFLQRSQFVMQASHSALEPSPLGKATAVSGIAPKDAICVLKPLQDARRKLVTNSSAHIIFLVTPPASALEPPWACLHHVLKRLSENNTSLLPVLDCVGASENDPLLEYYANPSVTLPKYPYTNMSPEAASKHMMYRRLYSALILDALTAETALVQISGFLQLKDKGGDYADLARGTVQSLQKEASTFSFMVATFCRSLNWDALASACEAYSARLALGVKEELLPLARMGAEMPAHRARAFFKSGLTNPLDISNANVDVVTGILMSMTRFTSSAPTQVGKFDTSASSSSSAAVTGGESERKKALCEALARKIIKRAVYIVGIELDSALERG